MFISLLKIIFLFKNNIIFNKEMSKGVKNIFGLFNCFNNYEIVASKIIEFYIKNAATYLARGQPIEIKTYQQNTPYTLYTLYMLPPASPGVPGLSKQTSDYVAILALSAVTLARIWNSDMVVFPHQGVTLDAGFSVMYTMANQLNKKTAYWSDDIRTQWGDSDDPLVIGMSPLPYKYMWNATTKKGQPLSMDLQNKGLNGPYVQPQIAHKEDLCPPVVDTGKFKNRWNTFIEAIISSESIANQSIATGVSERTKKLIGLGKAIIQVVEKGATTEAEKTARWQPYTANWGKDFLTRPKIMFYWIYNTIYSNMANYLYTEEQAFLKENTPATWMHPTVSAERAVQLAMTMPPVPEEKTLPNFQNMTVVNPTVITDQTLITVMGMGMSRLAETKL
jgi:hypothetical protein